jgi:hypothetical protein
MTELWLSLCPVNPEIELDFVSLKASLLDMGLIGSRCKQQWDKDDEEWFLTGHTFYDFLHQQPGTYALHPCTIQVRDLGGVYVISSPYAAETQPACRRCGHALTEAFNRILDKWWSNQKDFRYRCPNCSVEQKIWELDWREFTAVCRYEIHLHGIHPPAYSIQPGLWSALKHVSGIDWQPVWCML